MDEWIAWKDINFSREQMFFLIEHLEEIKIGDWPPNPDGSSYTDIPSQATPKPYAYYTKPCEIAAECEFRLNRTKKDGETLVWDIQRLGVDIYENLSPRAKVALNYISGWRRRKTSFVDWETSRNYYKNVTNNFSK